MLQAPVGANLGEIASSLSWASNLLDNSDTLTAESESNENEDVNEYYNLLKNSKGEFLLNEANLVPQQVSSVLASDNESRFPSDLDNRANDKNQNWTITSVEVPDGDLQSSKMFYTICYNNTDPTANMDNNLAYQTDTPCNGGLNFFNFDTQDINYATNTDMMANDPSDICYLQNFGKHSWEMNTEYFRNDDTGQNNVQQNVCANDQQYFYSRFTQETNNLLNERLEQPQSNLVTFENNQETGTGNLQRPANGGSLKRFWQY